jgi:hypothetical protein
VLALKLAHAGLLVILKVRLSLSASLAVGVNWNWSPSATELASEPEIVGAELLPVAVSASTIISN